MKYQIDKKNSGSFAAVNAIIRMTPLHKYCSLSNRSLNYASKEAIGHSSNSKDYLI